MSTAAAALSAGQRGLCVCVLHLILFRAVHRNGDGDGDGDGVFGVAEERRHHAVWRDG